MLSALFVLLAAASGPAPWEGEPFSAPASEMRRAADALPVPTGTPFEERLYEEAVVRYDEQQRETFTFRRVVLVRGEAGIERNSQVYATWAPWHQDKPRIRARVIAPDGTESMLQTTTLAEMPAESSSPDVFTDERAIGGPLPTLQVGSILEQETTWTDRTPFFDAGIARDLPIGGWMPVRRIRLRVSAPASVPLRLETRETDVRVVRTVEKGVVTFTVDTTAPGREWEAESEVPRPRVAWSTGKSWKEIAEAYSTIVDSRISSGRVPAPAVQGKSREETIAAILAGVHRGARYTGVEFGQAAIVPAAPSEVLSRGFGDCKDKATLLVAQLRAAGIPANVALLNAGDVDFVEEEMPGLSFNHAIVHVGGKPEMWIDPTYEFARAGDLPFDDRGRLALIVSPSTKRLVRTPPRTPDANRIEITREIQFAEYGPARIVETSLYYGTQEQMMRTSWAPVGLGPMRERFEKDANQLFSPKKVQVELPDVRDLSKTLRIATTSDGVERAATTLEEAAVYADVEALYGLVPYAIRSPGGTESRKSAWRPSYPGRVSLRYILVPPSGFRMPVLPEAESRRFGTLAYAFRPSRDGERVLLEWTLDTGVGPLSPADVEALREHYQEGEELHYRFEHTGEALLASGRVTEALREFRSLRERRPDDALSRSRIASALLAGGLGAAARKESAAAVALAPEHPVVHSIHASILMHDELGRRAHPGMDRDGAIASFRRAAELQPDEVSHLRALGLMLRIDELGNSKNDRASLLEAAAVLRKAHAIEPDGAAFDTLFLDTLFRLGELAELRKAAEAAPLEIGISFLIAATAAEKGAEAAVEDANRRLRAEREAPLNFAIGLLVETRRYEQAAALMSEVARISTGTAKLELQVRSGMLKNVKKFTRTDARTPEAVVRNLVTGMVAGELKPAELLAAIPPRYVDDKDKQDALNLLEDNGMRKILTRKGVGSFPPEVLADIVGSVAEMRSEGDEHGWRVSISFNAPAGPSSLDPWFVLKEDGRFYLMTGDLDLPVKEARRLAEKGNVDAARRWMGWAVEGMPIPGSDPGFGRPAAHLWPKAGATADDVRVAAAAHLVEDPESVTVLQRAFESANGTRAIAIGRSLVEALRRLDRDAEALKIAERIGTIPAGRDSSLVLRAVMLRKQKKWAEALEMLEREKAARPEATFVDAQIDATLYGKGDLATLIRRRRDAAEKGTANADGLNGLAWDLLIEGTALDEAVQWAERSCAASRYKSSAALHTLAVAYAETGRAAQAREALIASMQLVNAEKLRPHDWYVIGRLAEDFDVPDVARDAYERVRTDPESDAKIDSTWRMAERRLAKLPAR